ncbi:MAG: hypothetical protein HYT77_01440 [Deltaproteobacteria bacterium]|nr:hypothetical protein [Deltaproteobacteria bacterium]
MRFLLLIGMFLNLLTPPLWGAGDPVEGFRKRYLSREFRYEKEMSLEAKDGFFPIRGVPKKEGEGALAPKIIKPTIAVFTTNLDFEGVRRMFQLKKVELELWDKEAAQKQRVKRPPLGETREGQDHLKNRLEIPNYQSGSVRMEDGSILLLKSHYYHTKDKTWIKKTTVTWIGVPPSPSQTVH